MFITLTRKSGKHVWLFIDHIQAISESVESDRPVMVIMRDGIEFLVTENLEQIGAQINEVVNR